MHMVFRNMNNQLSPSPRPREVMKTFISVLVAVMSALNPNMLNPDLNRQQIIDNLMTVFDNLYTDTEDPFRHYERVGMGSNLWKDLMKGMGRPPGAPWPPEN